MGACFFARLASLWWKNALNAVIMGKPPMISSTPTEQLAALERCRRIAATLPDEELIAYLAGAPSLAERAAAARALLQGHDVNAPVEGCCGGTLLHYTASVPLAKALLEAGADPNARGDYRDTPLHSAFSPEIATLLLDAGADIDAQDHVSDTALHGACSSGHIELVRLLLERGANPNIRGMQMQTPIFHAQSAEMAELLLAAGADPNAEDVDEWVPLHVANAKVTRVLLAHGAEPMVCDRGDITPLAWAEDPEKIRLLLQAGARLCEVDYYSGALFHNRNEGELEAWLAARGGRLADMPQTAEMEEFLLAGQQGVEEGV